MDALQSEHTASFSQGLVTSTRFLLECGQEWPFAPTSVDAFGFVSYPSFDMHAAKQPEGDHPLTPPNSQPTYSAYYSSTAVQRPATPPLATPRRDTQAPRDNKLQAPPKRPGRKRRAELDMDSHERDKLLERNRVAALKCRQKKKKWMQDLEEQSEIVSARNKHLRDLVAELREESMFLRNQLLAHGNCNCAMVQSYLQRTSAQLAAVNMGSKDPPSVPVTQASDHRRMSMSSLGSSSPHSSLSGV